MKVLYTGTTATEQLKNGVVLRPGENDVPDDVAAQMLAAGLVKKPAGVAPASAVIPEPGADSGPAVHRRRGRADERLEERA